MYVVNRKDKSEYQYEYSKTLKFLYNKMFGRFILKILCNKLVANIVAMFMNSSLSKFLVKRHMKKYHIDINLYDKESYTSYNDYFTRKLKKTNINKEQNTFISPCDSKLLVIPIEKNQTFDIKGSKYYLEEIIDDEVIKKYQNGYAMIFRLDVNDYHRYCYIDSGSRTKYHYIKGMLHTVQPIVYDKEKVFHKNCREWTMLKTDHFGDIIQVEVGAMLIGKINNYNQNTTFQKGEEKGYFEFGGSTIILFIEKDKIIIDNDILENSLAFKETIVHYGEKIGKKSN